MSAATDRVRFQLERTVSELQDLQQKGIFSKGEIGSILKKRSAFEHKINSRNSSVADYIRYTEFELNLDTLRKKRVNRLGIKDNSRHSKKRVLLILDRATKKHHGNVDIWLQYISYARQAKATKILEEIFTAALRLHPTKSELWIHAAQYVLEAEADMQRARNYLQRGLRFCPKCQSLWLEYAKFELLYIKKIITRRQLLALPIPDVKTLTYESEPRSNDKALAVPEPTEVIDQLDSGGKEPDSNSGELSQSPLLHGETLIAIFDAAVSEVEGEAFAQRFFALFTSFHSLPCSRRLAKHVVDYLMSVSPKSTLTLTSSVIQPTIGIDSNSVEFPAALMESLEILSKNNLLQCQDRVALCQLYSWVSDLLFGRDEEVARDVSIRSVLLSTLRQITERIQPLIMTDFSNESDDLQRIITVLEKANLKEDAQALESIRSRLKRSDAVHEPLDVSNRLV